MSIVFPICEMTPFMSRWTIQARVTVKSDLRTFNRNASQGKVFSVDLLDKDGGEIRASFFNQAAETWFERLQVGKCYTFSKGSVKVANRQYNKCDHKYELTFDRGAIVAEVPDDGAIEVHKFNFVDLRRVQSRPLPTTIDLCGVIVKSDPVFSFTSKEGKPLVKREITVADDTAASMDITLWGDRAQQDDAKFNGSPIVALKGVSVKEWNGGLSGSLMQSGCVDFEPQGDVAERVRRWWACGVSLQSLSALSVSRSGGTGGSRKACKATIKEMREQADAIPDDPKLLRVTARLASVQTTKQGEPHSLTYLACTLPREGTNGLVCNRRVDESGHCESCGRYGNPAARINVRCRFVDFGENAWLTTFSEAASSILRMTPDELRDLERQALGNGADGWSGVEERLQQTYYSSTPLQLTCRVKADTYQGERRGNATCIEARPICLREHGRSLLDEIKQMVPAC